MSLETSRLHHQHTQLAGTSLAPALHPMKGIERVTARCLSMVGSRIQAILFVGQVGIKEPVVLVYCFLRGQPLLTGSPAGQGSGSSKYLHYA